MKAQSSKNGHLMPNSAADFKKFREEQYFADVTLPSGLRARLRPVDATLFAEMGKIPDLLTTQIMEQVVGKGGIDITKVDPQQLMVMTRDLQYAVACAAFVSPRVSMTPGEDEIHPSVLIGDDLEYVAQFQNMGVEQLKSFRSQSEGYVAPVAVGKDDGQPAESDSGD